MIGSIARIFARESACLSSALRGCFSSSTTAHTRVFAWGEGASGQLGNGKNKRPKEEGVSAPKVQAYAEKFPVEITQLNDYGDKNQAIVQIDAGGDGSGALTTGGELYLWGSNDRVRFMHFASPHVCADIGHNHLFMTWSLTNRCNVGHLCSDRRRQEVPCLAISGALATKEKNMAKILFTHLPNCILQVNSGGVKFKSFSMSKQHVAAISTDGKIYTWGQACRTHCIASL